MEIWRGKLANESVFLCCKNNKNDSVQAIGKSGSVYCLEINEGCLVPYLI